MSIRSKAVVAAATTCAIALLAGPASAAPAPGAPGIGDPYYPNAGNGGYDVSHYDIRLNYQPATDLLSGSTTISAKATQDLSKFNLDFLLKVSSVRVNNKVAGFTQQGGELVIDPKGALHKGSDLTVVVTYSDTPSKVQGPGGFTAWKRTATGALAIDEPDIAPWWYPSNNHPTDKATFDVSVAVPDGTEVVSNGLFKGTTKQINGWTRWNWRSLKPQNTYATYVVIGQFEVRNSTTPSGQPYITAYAEGLGEYEGAAKASVERTAEIIEFEENYFGPYPFEAQGGVVTPGVGFALENQTRPVYDQAFWRRGLNTYVVAHENAHQWFGDSVSVHGWKDIWLNEGFASYAEWLWSEHLGEGTAQENSDFVYASYPADDPFWQVLPGDPGPANQFDNAVYDRGALTLHALRTTVGDDAFFKILKTWVQQHEYSDGSIEQFIGLSEKISGKPLHELFQTWLFTKGKPAAAPGAAAVRTLTAPAEPKSFRTIRETHQMLAREH
jgi:aminopeptidase N